MKKLMLGAALSALMLSPGMAQTPAPYGGQSKAPPPAAQNQPAAKPDADAAKPAAPKPAASAPAPKSDQTAAKPAAAGGKAEFVSAQKPDQWLASKFKGTDVVGTDDKKIGDVTDILFDKTGKIEAFVISVGGFLGMGAKEVALAPSAFDVVPGDKGGADKLKIAMTKEQLKQAQNFAHYQPPRPATTTGSAGGLGGPRPAGGAPTGR